MDENSDSNQLSDEFLQFYLDFVLESDRAAAVLGAAKLDFQLKKLIEKTLLSPYNKGDNILNDSKALGTFSARIHIAYRLGLINKELARALHLIRKIRNKFAHEINSHHLKEHEDQVKELIKPLITGNGYGDMYKIVKGKMNPSEQSAVDFRISLGAIASKLEEAIQKTTTLSSQKAVGLIPLNWHK